MSSPALATRRRFLRRAGVLAAGALIAATGAWRFARSAAAPLYHRLLAPPPHGGVAALSPEEARTLIAATNALLVVGIDVRRYEDFFRWKSAHVPGYRDLYARFRIAVDAAAKQAGAPSFEAASQEARRTILTKASRLREALNRDDKLTALSIALFDREWLSFERYITREILTLFARTDAWRLAGYGPHPGVPRGLDAYRAAPTEGA